MIQFNLLPDVKKQYIKAKRTKRLIMTVSAISVIASVTVVFLLFSFVQFAQKKNITDLTEDIEKEIAATESIEDLDKILTIQNQLNTLTDLHESKPESSRILDYLVQLSPELVKISDVSLDFESSTIEISGTADSLATVNQYVDTFKFSKYKTSENEEEESPFFNVISDSSRSEDSTSYTINMEFDPKLFDNTLTISLIVPEKVTTRSVIGKPSIDNLENSLFEQSEEGEQ